MTIAKALPIKATKEFFYQGKYRSYQEIEDVGYELYLDRMSKAGKPRPCNPELSDQLLVASTNWCDRIGSHIRCAYENLESKTALILIGSIWEQLDRTTKLAASRSRILAGQLDGPPLADTPAWLSQELSGLSVHDVNSQLGPSHPLAINAAEKLIRSAILDLPDSVEASVCRAPHGHVFVDWEVSPNVLQWEISPSSTPWPGVVVHSVFCNRQAGAEIKARIFHNAFDAINNFRESLREHAGFK